MSDRLNLVIEELGDGGQWSNEYWDSLFRPLRRFLIKSLRRKYRLDRDDIADAADEIIYRLFKTYRFARLAELPKDQRCAAFYAFVNRTIRSVVGDVYAQKGLLPVRKERESSEKGGVFAGQAVEVVATAFKSLPFDDQQILRYRIFQKLGYRVIQLRYADEHEQEVSVNALKMRYLRAMRALQAKIRAAGGH